MPAHENGLFGRIGLHLPASRTVLPPETCGVGATEHAARHHKLSIFFGAYEKCGVHRDHLHRRRYWQTSADRRNCRIEPRPSAVLRPRPLHSARTETSLGSNVVDFDADACTREAADRLPHPIGTRTDFDHGAGRNGAARGHRRPHQGTNLDASNRRSIFSTEANKRHEACQTHASADWTMPGSLPLSSSPINDRLTMCGRV